MDMMMRGRKREQWRSGCLFRTQSELKLREKCNYKYIFINCY